MLSYPTVTTFTIWGTKSGTTRSAIALTSAYQSEVGFTKPTKAFEVGGYSKMNVDILYTEGSGESSNSIQIKIEGSPDGTNYYALANESASGGTSTLTAREFTFTGADAAAATISIGLDIFYKYVKISGKETGVATNAGTAYAEVTLLGL